MSEYPNSPFQVARRLVDQLDQGALPAEEFLSGLDRFVSNLENWYAQLESIHTSDVYPEGKLMVEHAKEALQAVYDGADLLREYAENRSPEVSAEALAIMAQAGELLAQLLSITEENLK